MSEPKWLTLSDCHTAHEMLLSAFGGLSGTRDEGLLTSALHRPQQLFTYADPSLFDMAAAYAHGMVKNYPFIDGNKRTAFIAAAWFLENNGLRLDAPEEEAVLHTLALAAGEEDEADYAKWLEASCEDEASYGVW